MIQLPRFDNLAIQAVGASLEKIICAFNLYPGEKIFWCLLPVWKAVKPTFFAVPISATFELLCPTMMFPNTAMRCEFFLSLLFCFALKLPDDGEPIIEIFAVFLSGATRRCGKIVKHGTTLGSVVAAVFASACVSKHGLRPGSVFRPLRYSPFL